MPQVDLAYLGYDQISGHTFAGVGAIPALIMRGRNKEFFFANSYGKEWTEFWDGLWWQAAEALRRSAQFVICGYSLLAVDERACDLLLRMLDENSKVTVVSGDQSDWTAGDFRRAGFVNVASAQNRYFEDWVGSPTTLLTSSPELS